MNKETNFAGHRERLRKRFLEDRAGLSDAQLLELLLTYAIPRRDVAATANALLEAFGSLEAVLSASHEELIAIDGIGDVAAILLETARELQQRTVAEDTAISPSQEEQTSMDMQQEELFPLSGEPDSNQATAPKPPPPPPTKADIRAFTADLIQVALGYLPDVVNYGDAPSFMEYLEQNLPFNSANTRKRYSRYLLRRYFDQGQLGTLMTRFLIHSSDEAAWKDILFYETTRAEPAVQFVAEDVIWPALPSGFLDRDTLKSNVQERFAEASEATIKRMLYSLVNLYTLLDVATQQANMLKFQTRQGTLEAFVYILAAEFAKPGIYSFEALEQGPMRRWLLWDRAWMRRQLYNLRDMGVIAKISEIDAMRQFTLSTGQMETIEDYFGHPRRDELALRETAATLEGDS